MKVSVEAKVTIADDQNPQDVRFSSGSKSYSNTADFAESESSTFSLAAAAVDQSLPLGSLSLISVLYLFTTSSSISVKLTPQAGGTPLSMELIPNVPAVLPFKISAVSASNGGGSVAKLIYGAAGN